MPGAGFAVFVPVDQFEFLVAVPRAHGYDQRKWDRSIYNHDHGAPNVDHICFLVQPRDTETMLEHLRQFEVQHGPVGACCGATGQGPSVYIEDPEGNHIELKGRD